ncbi:MAG: hypothetical protein J7641_16900 [Cyanobacteria bacterium SID2]|nr:hypothetical protein [Cyanobacteria bacterium SID2]MBP0004991.1 hypothetical protein [Cyanobacteria bacterium SBC]
MRRAPRSSGIVRIAVVAVLLALSAGGMFAVARYRSQQQKLAQCNQLVDLTNQGYAKAIAFQGQDATALDALAGDLATVAQNLRSLDMTDETLQQQRQQVAQAYRELSEAYRQMGTALKLAETSPASEVGLDRVQQARAEVKAAGSAAHQAARYVDELAVEIDRYCGVALK